MKTSPYFKILFLFAFIGIISCSKKEDPIGIETPNLSIVLSSDAGSEELQIVSPEQMVTFTITGSDGEDCTNNSQIFVNDIEIEGPTYTFSEMGTFSIKAVYGTVNSNILNFQVLADTERALTVDVTRAMNGQSITFALLDNNGNNTASEATFFVNGNAISGFTYSSASDGDFEVYAQYIIGGETFTSSVKNFSVYIPRRKVVLEDYTGTWCGYCLDALIVVEHVRELTEHVSVVAIHKTSFSLPDPLDFPQILDLQAEFNVDNAFPQTYVNRTTVWNDPYDYDFITNMAGAETDVSIAVNSQITNSNLSIDVKVVYRNGSEAGDKLVVYLIESGVIADQANYFNNVPGHPYQGFGNPIPNFVHNDGIRKSLSGLFGDNIPETAAYKEVSKSYTYSVPAEYNAENLSFVVMIVKADNAAKNSQHSKLGESKVFE
jgi:thiol-disulfide isomerase/thioredoxin